MWELERNRMKSDDGAFIARFCEPCLGFVSHSDLRVQGISTPTFRRKGTTNFCWITRRGKALFYGKVHRNVPSLEEPVATPRSSLLSNRRACRLEMSIPTASMCTILAVSGCIEWWMSHVREVNARSTETDLQSMRCMPPHSLHIPGP